MRFFVDCGMLLHLFKQPVHIIHSLRARHKLELLFLLIIIGAVVTLKTQTLIGKMITANPHITHMGLMILLVNIQLFFWSFSSFFSLAHLLPQQKGLRVLNVHPLDKKAVFQLYFYYTFKFSSAYLLLNCAVSIALLQSTGFRTGLGHLLLILITELLLLGLLIAIRMRQSTLSAYYLQGLLSLIVYFMAFALIYFMGGSLIYLQGGLLIMLTATLFLLYKPAADPPEQLLSRGTKRVAGTNRYQARYLQKIPHLFPVVIQALLEKELRGLWRNPLYRRLKIRTLAGFFFIMLLIGIFPLEYNHLVVMILTIAVFWLHFNSGFNEKYMPPDNVWLIRSQPIRFYQYFLARYFSEMPVFLILTFGAIGGLFLSPGLTTPERWSAFLVIFLFAQLLLLSMINFQVMFYDDVRLAGYAFHFSALFSGIMILNYRLVGPIVILGLLLFYFYKNHHYFSGKP